MPLPPRLYPSTAFGLWFLYDQAVTNHLFCYVLLSARADPYTLEKNLLSPVTGAITSALFLGAFVRFSIRKLREYASTEDPELSHHERTSRFFELIRAIAVINTFR